MFKGIKYTIGKLFITLGFRLGDFFSDRGWKMVALNAPSEMAVMTFATEHFKQRGINIRKMVLSRPDLVGPDPEAPPPPPTFSN